MAVSAKIKNLAPGAYFNAGPVEVVVLEHFTDGRTLLAAKEPIGNRPFTVRPFTYNRMEPEPAANNFAFSTLCHDLCNERAGRKYGEDGYGDEYLVLLTADTVREMAFSAWCEIRNAEITAAREKAVGA